jgi:hypothetical protein
MPARQEKRQMSKKQPSHNRKTSKRSHSFRALVTVDVHPLKADDRPQIIMQIPPTFQAADAAVQAGLASMAWGTGGNKEAVREIKKYLASLPETFDGMVQAHTDGAIELVFDPSRSDGD